MGRDAIRRGSDGEQEDYSDFEDEVDDEIVDGGDDVDDDEAVEIAELNAVRRRAKRSQALRKKESQSIRYIRNGGRGPNLTRSTSVVEDDAESQEILSLVRRVNDASSSQSG